MTEERLKELEKEAAEGIACTDYYEEGRASAYSLEEACQEIRRLTSIIREITNA